MGRYAYSRARWHAHVDNISPPKALQSWLTDKGSLTVKLTSACSQFRVRLMRESGGRGMGGECKAMGLPRRTRLWQREVLLQCDGESVVYARTVVPYDSLSGWPWLQDLGENSLGVALFADPHVIRGSRQFAGLQADHPIRCSMLHALQLQYSEQKLYARRSEFQRSRSWMLVTEVFLPSIMELSKHEPAV